MNSIVTGVKTFLKQNPTVDSVVRHFLAAFVAAFVVAEVGLLSHLSIASVSPSTLVSSEIALVIAAAAAAVRAVVPFAANLLPSKKAAAPTTPAKP